MWDEKGCQVSFDCFQPPGLLFVATTIEVSYLLRDDQRGNNHGSSQEVINSNYNQPS